MTTDSRNTSEYTQMLVRIAHKLMDDGHESEGDEILVAVHGIRTRSLVGSLPPTSVMRSLDLLMQDQKIQYAVIGGIALGLHGQVRNTEDIDALVQSMPDSIQLRDSAYMETFGFYKGRSSTGTVLTLDHRQNGQVELLAATTPLMEWALSTAQPATMLGVQVPVVSAAALVALKVHAMGQNPKRRSKDMPDILSVLTKSHPDMSEAMGYLDESESTELQKLLAVLG